MKTKTIAVLLIKLVIMFVQMSASSDNDGFIVTTGNGILSHSASSNTSRFIWEGDDSILQAGIYLPALGDMGDFSLAFGNYPMATGDFSFSFGSQTQANGYGSFAFGHGEHTEWPLIANGDHSFSFGRFTYASAYSLAFGYMANAWPSHTISIGQNTYAAANSGNIAIGRNSHSFGSDSLAVGYNNMSDGVGSVALGYSNNSSGDYSFSVGTNSNAIGYASVSMGYLNTVVGGTASVSMGYGNQIMATNATAFALGKDLKIVTSGTPFVIGRSNLRTSGTSGAPAGDFIFVVGNGEPGSYRSDAFSVDSGGNVWTAGNITSAAGNNYFQGNVGIGTSSPSYKVEVVGGSSGAQTSLLQIRSNSTTTNTASTLRFANSSNSTAPQGAGEITTIRTNDGVSGTSEMIFKVSQGNSLQEGMRLDSEGFLHVKVPAKGGISMGNFN